MPHHHSLVPGVTSVLCVVKPGTMGFNINFAYKLSEVHSDVTNSMKSKQQFGSKTPKSKPPKKSKTQNINTVYEHTVKTTAMHT